MVGAGISGLVCAHVLGRAHDVTLFEAEGRLGGHSSTVDVEHEGRRIAVDTGFIVFNERNYPLLCELLRRLEIKSQPAPMTFGVRDDRTGLEYGGASLNTLFAQRRNALSPRFLAMIRDILRFYRDAASSLDAEPLEMTLGDYLERQRYGKAFREQFLVPMAAAIWSSPDQRVDVLPLHFVVRFFENHGMLTLRDRPQWRTIPGGSRRYVEAISARLANSVRRSARVESIARLEDGIEVRAVGDVGRFDHVILACHSDQALAVLSDASEAEREILGAIAYQANDTVLHTDQSLMPRNRRAWSAWNGRVTRGGRGKEAGVAVTYDLTILQSLETRDHLLVTLNQTDEVDAEKILARFTYDHPVFTVEGERAKARYGEIGGVAGTHFCGAYWRNGFHEDGVWSALRVCERFGMKL